MFKRPHYIVWSGVILLALIVIGLPKQTSSQIKLALSSLFLPLFGMAGAGSKIADKAAEVVIPRRVLEAQVDALKKENDRLKFDLAQNAQALEENAQLRAAVGWARRQRWPMKVAKVQSRDPANWWRTIQLDVGRRDGVAENMPVLTPEGLVGRVDEVGLFASRVVLLGDPNCRVASWVVESKDAGVIAPGSSSVLDQSVVQLTYLSRHSQAKPGFRVVTSGQGGIFPSGIPIGSVVDVESVGQGLYMEARVKLAADLQRLEMVWVILGGRQ